MDRQLTAGLILATQNIVSLMILPSSSPPSW